VVVSVRESGSWQFEGPLASRAQVFAHQFLATLPAARRRPFQVLVEQCPEEHTGLGVGTALGLAVARSLAVAMGQTMLPAAELAVSVGRGLRSAVGVHGFERGGLIVEAGKSPGEAVSPLAEHVSLPDAWRVVLFTPGAPTRWHGEQERRVFSQTASTQTDVLLQLAEQSIVPAARAANLTAFGDAVHEFNRLAGEPFVTAQGGTYCSGEAAQLVSALREAGVHCVGQSSWGPTIFAVVESSAAAQALRAMHTTGRVVRISRGHTVTPANPHSK
jgi:beta-RFAP synthase